MVVPVPPPDPHPEALDSESFRRALLGLTSEDINQRIEAVQLLGQSRRIEAVKPLRQAFRDGGNILRSYARQALERLQEELQLERLTLMESMAEDRDTVAEEGREPSRRLNLKKLKDHLESNDPKIRIGVAQAAAQFREKDALPLLVDRLDREYHLFVVASLLLAIGKLGGDNELEILYPFLKHEDERIRANALEAIQHTGSRQVDLARILPLISDPSERVANNAARLVALFDAGRVEESPENVRQDPAAVAAVQALDAMRRDSRPRPVIQAAPPRENSAKSRAVLAGIAALTMIITLTVYIIFFRTGTPPSPVPEPGPSRPQANPDLVRQERLRELETLLRENKLARAEILLRLAVKEHGDDSLTRLLLADFLVRRELWLKAMETLNGLPVADERRNHRDLLLARCELGLGERGKAKQRLEELQARAEDEWVRQAGRLLEELRARLQAEDAAVLSGVRGWLEAWNQALSLEDPRASLEVLIEDAALRRALERQWELETGQSGRWQLQRQSVEVRLEERREGSRAVAESLEMLLGILPGGIPAFRPYHRLYIFRYDSRPGLLNLLSGEEGGKRSDHPLALLARAWNLRNRNLAEAANILKGLVGRFPENGYMVWMLAETLQSLGQAAEIVPLLDGRISSLRFDPRHPAGDKRLRAELRDLLANAWRDLGQQDSYAVELQRAAGEATDHCRIQVEVMALGLERGDHEAWAEGYRRVFAVAPDYPFLDRVFYPSEYAVIEEVRGLIEAQNFRDAMEKLTGLRQKNPDYWRIYAETGEIFYRLERSDQAIVQLEEALRRNPGHPGLMRRLAQSFLQNEEFTDAEHWARKALERDDRNESRQLLDAVLARKTKP